MILLNIPRPSTKKRTFRHTKIFFNNNTETEETSFSTYLCLLFHIVAFDIKALSTFSPVFVYPLYTTWPPTAFLMCLSFAKRLSARCSFILETGKSSTVPVPDCTEDTRRCPNEIAHAERLVSGGHYADVHCCAAEQFQAGACLFGKIIQNLIGLQKTNNTSHFTVCGIFNRHSHGHSYHCTYQVTRFDAQLQEQLFNIALNTRNEWWAATKHLRGLLTQTFFSLWMAFEY